MKKMLPALSLISVLSATPSQAQFNSEAVKLIGTTAWFATICKYKDIHKAIRGFDHKDPNSYYGLNAIIQYEFCRGFLDGVALGSGCKYALRQDDLPEWFLNWAKQNLDRQVDLFQISISAFFKDRFNCKVVL